MILKPRQNRCPSAIRWWMFALVIGACGEGAPPPEDAAAAAELASRAERTLTLISGDRVIVSPDGGVRVVPGAGRDGVGFSTLRRDNETLVVPRDMARFVASGQLDRGLFNITELLAQNYDDAHRSDLPLLVTGPLDAAAVGRRMASSGLVVDRVMPTARAVAARQRKGAPSALLSELSNSPAQQIWLDRMYKPSLDRSVPQIGAPAAWASGYTGAGVVVAVLDTGVEATHPDLAGKVRDAEKFVTDGRDASDVVGHGTHVASTIAGTGAASGGQFRGAAPDAELISARVCTEFGCPTSAILAGIEWAVVTKGAKIINMSLGGRDRPGIDPLENAVDQFSADRGVLFVIASGNDGESGAGTVDSPGSADAALTVGAVDHDERLAVFSGRGPRIGDRAIKPDITAPGVGIVAARATVAPPDVGEPVGTAYLRLSGTSMATPHVAAAAAILLQQHPDWSGSQLKAALTGSANPNAALTAFEQGAGRVDVARAVRQGVIAEPTSLNFGRALWPHDDDPLLRRTVAYRNTTAAPITLALAGSLAHAGAPVAGMVTVEPASITVPAGGTAEAIVIVDTNGERPDGFYTGALVATADDVRLVSPLAVEREVPSSELTIETLDRSGSPVAGNGIIDGAALGDLDPFFPTPGTLRLPHGQYWVKATPDIEEHVILMYPQLELTRPTTIVMDGRVARPAEFVVAGQPLERKSMEVVYRDTRREFISSSFGDILTGHLGPDSAPGEIHSFVIATAVPEGATDGRSFYLFGHRERDRFLTGTSQRITADQLATVDMRHGRADRHYEKFILGSLDDLPEAAGVAPDFLAHATYRGPVERTDHFFGAGFKWAPVLNEQREVAGELQTTRIAGQSLVRYRPGHSTEQWNRGPFGPSFADRFGRSNAKRQSDSSGDRFRLTPTMFSAVSSPSRMGLARGTQRWVVYRDGVKMHEVDDDSGLATLAPFAVPPERATYRFEVEATRPPEIAELSPRVTAAWTFTSEDLLGSTVQALPLPVLRFTPALDEQNRALRALPLLLPVEIERPPGAATPAIAHVSVEASFDDGATWSRVIGAQLGARWLGVIQHPANAAYVSLRGSARDVDGNRVEQTILRAYALAP